MLNLSWMAWTLPTALFFGTILILLVAMGIWEYFSPGGSPRIGILRFETTRGDRLFISLLGSAFIHLAWLGLAGSGLWSYLASLGIMSDLWTYIAWLGFIPGLWWALALSFIYAILVFVLV